MSVCNHSVQANLMQVWCLKLEHLENAITIDLIGGVDDLLAGTVFTSKAGVDELLAVLVEQVESVEMGTCGDLDQLGKAVTDLCLGQSAEEGEIKEGVHGSMIGAEAILVISVVDGDFDGHGGVYQTNDGCRHADVVCVPAIGGASEPVWHVIHALAFPTSSLEPRAGGVP